MFDPALEMKGGRAAMPDGHGWGIRVEADWLPAFQPPSRLSPPSLLSS